MNRSMSCIRVSSRLGRFALAALLCVGLVSGLASAEAQAPESADVLALRERIAANPEDLAARQELGDVLFREGHAFASMKIQNPGRTPDASWAIELRKSAAVYSEVGESEAARRALKAAIDLAPGDASLYEELAALYQERPRQAEVPPAQSGAAESAASDRPRPRPISPATEAMPIPVWLLGVGIALLLTALLVARRVARGKGDLAVSIECPPDHRGTFSVRLSGKRSRGRVGAVTAAPENRASSRFEHNMIAGETHFRAIPARSYWVTIEGQLTSPSGEAQGVRRDSEVRIEKGRTAALPFDLRPQACAVEIKIQASGEPVGEARVAVSGDPTSIRLAKSGTLSLHLDPGTYGILVGVADRAAERTIEVTSLEALGIVIDLDLPADLEDGATLAFEGCEAAVEPFLRGDLSVAASALERIGQKAQADLLLARFHQNHGATEDAASRFEAAGRLLEAAELWSEQGEFERAATLFERGNDPARAGEMYNAAGDLLRAGRSYEEAGDYEAAIICYRESQAPRLLDALEKHGEAFEAGKLALDQGDASRAVRNFQHVGARDANYFEACRILATTFTDQGRLELAVQKADEAITVSRPDETSPDTFVWYGDLLARAGRPDRAIAVFEDLAERAPEHPGVQTRIDEIRKEVSRQKQNSAVTEAIPQAFDDSSRYEIVTEVGSGGMGIVYHARDRRLGRDVALKRLPDNLKDHPRAVDLFLREARASAALNHPNIVTVHDVDQEGGLYFITMELLRGQTLSEIVKQHERLQALDVVRIGAQIATGLGFAHQQGIVHRDIKSANLFLTHDRIVKIMDFGLAKMMEEVRRATTVVGGTPYYMAPEQAIGQDVDHRTDIYAFGVTLFELATGRRPFEEGDVTWHHQNTPAPDPRAMGAEIPEDMATLILQMMAKDREDRPGQAEAVGRRLQQIGQALKR